MLRKECRIDIQVQDAPSEDIDDCDISKDILPGITLFEFQVIAARKAIMLKEGLSIIPTGGGKTEVILSVLRYLFTNNRIKTALIVVPSVSLAEQLCQRAYDRGFTGEEIAPLHGNARRTNSKIVVGVVNSLNLALKRGDETASFIAETDALIYDEAHHWSATSYLTITLVAKKARYCLGYSGSPFRESNILDNPSDALLYGITGRVIYTIGHRNIRDLGLIAEPYVYFKPIGGMSLKYQGQYNKIYERFIVKNQQRNESIVYYTKKFVSLKFSVLILVQRLDHARILMGHFKGLNAISVFGGGSGLQYNEVGLIEEVPIEYNIFRQNFEAGLYDIAIMSQVGDEGIDVPSIGAVILAGGGKSRIKNLQRIGRGLRRKKILNRVYILDFLDKGHVYMRSHSKKRLALFEEIEATIDDDEYRFMNTIIQHSQLLESVKEGNDGK